jgi:hypothetical protein
MTRRIAILILLLSPVLAVAQFTSVTASVGSTLSNATYTFDFINQSGLPGPPLLGGRSVFPTQVVGSFDSFGGLFTLVATNGQVLPLPSQWRLSVGMTPCPGVKQGFSIQFTVAGGSQDITGLLVPAIPSPPPACNSGGGGGAGNPAPPIFGIQFNCSGAFCASARATLDAVGDIKARSYDGLFSALDSQTVLSPASNDGIQQALSSTNSNVIVGPDYPCTEGSYSNPNGYRLGIGVPPPFAMGTQLFDYRLQCGTYGSYVYDIDSRVANGTWRFDRFVSNFQPQFSGGGYNLVPFLTDMELSGSGKNGFDGGGPDSQAYLGQNFEFLRRGIVGIWRVECQCYSLGDNALITNSISNQRGSTDGSGEGFETLRNNIFQNLTPMAVTATSTLAAGATLIPGTLANNVPFPSDGTYYIDVTKGGPLFKILTFTSPAGSTAGTWTVDSTLVPDNIGRSTAVINTPKQYEGGTTNATFTVTGLTSPIVTTATVCIADPAYQESSQVVSAGSFSGGTQSITVALRYTHEANFYVIQGSHACNFVEALANQVPGTHPGRQLFRILGALDAHTLLYARTVFGGWNNAPGNFYSSSVIAPAGATITRNGSNVASVTVADSNRLFSLNGIILSGCSDASFNSSGVSITTDTGTMVTWPSTGPAATTTCTNPIEILSRMSGFGVRLAQEFPGAEIVSTNDPATHGIDYTIPVEPNTNFQVSAGDSLENHVYNDVIMGFDHNLMGFFTQNADNIASVMHFDQIYGEIPVATEGWRIAWTDEPVHYQGLGGNKPIGNTLWDMSNSITPFAELFLNLPAPLNTAFSFIGCLFGCSDSRSKFNLFFIPTNSGAYTETIHQDTGTMEIFTSGAATSLDQSFSADGWFIVSTGTGIGEIFNVVPGQFESQALGGAGQSSIINQTQPKIEMDVIGVLGAASHVTQLVDRTTSDVPFLGPVTAPTGTCSPFGSWMWSQDGKGSFCKAGTWEVAVTAP